MKATPYRANRVLSLLRKMFAFALGDNEQEWGLTQNPAAGVSRFHEEKRERWLTEDEIARLSDAMEKYPDRRAEHATVSAKQADFVRSEAQRSVNAIRLLVLTGARKGEVLQAMWDQFDLERGVWTKPSHATKAHGVRAS